MISLLGLLLYVLVSPFKSQARLEAEIVLLRHQLNVLRRRIPSKPRLTVADRSTNGKKRMQSPLSGRTRSFDGIGRASACTGAGSRIHSAAGRRFRWRSAA